MSNFHLSFPTSGGRRPTSSTSTMNNEAYNTYLRNLTAHLEAEYEARRRHENNNVVTPGRATLPGDSPLVVKKVDQQLAANTVKHHTDKYELSKMAPKPKLVIRRGDIFHIIISFNRPFDAKKDRVTLEFNYGPEPKEAKKTKVELNITNKFGNVKNWTAKLDSAKDKKINLSVIASCTAMAGLWKMKILTSLDNEPKRKVTYEVPEDIYIIYNPWCKDDVVYLEDEELRNEYVLNDSGKIWMGSHNNNRGRRWLFGQFDDVVLPVCMLIFERTKLDVALRGNPIRVVRCLSAGVNSNDDDDGVVIGKWAKKPEEYKDGKAPWEWTGSVAILEEYIKNHGRPVKYGQCWVFSGVTTTLCRALGIPCRSITNFVSAHDTDGSLTVDKVFGPDGETKIESDSIWNFHVWNDVWMTRPDLPKGYGGWQAIDSTPQERSEGKFQVGPCSLEAIRKGHTSHMYDGPFVFAEVNADIVHWVEIEDKLEKGTTNKYHVGRSIITKSPYLDDDLEDNDAEDIVEKYKPLEGTDEERISVMSAWSTREDHKRYDMPDPKNQDMSFDLLEIDTIMIGENFDIRFQIKNKSKEERHVTVVLSCSTILYTGVTARVVSSRKFNLAVKPGAELPVRLTVTADDYLDKLVEQCFLKIYSVAKVEETRQIYSEEDDFVVIKPKLQLEILKEDPIISTPFELKMSFTNPLPYTLTKCKLSLEGTGLARPRFIDIGDIKPKQEMSHVESITPKESGTFKIVSVFNSKELNDIIGSKSLEIHDP